MACARGSSSRRQPTDGLRRRERFPGGRSPRGGRARSGQPDLRARRRRSSQHAAQPRRSYPPFTARALTSYRPPLDSRSPTSHKEHEMKDENSLWVEHLERLRRIYDPGPSTARRRGTAARQSAAATPTRRCTANGPPVRRDGSGADCSRKSSGTSTSSRPRGRSKRGCRQLPPPKTKGPERGASIRAHLTNLTPYQLSTVRRLAGQPVRRRTQ